MSDADPICDRLSLKIGRKDLFVDLASEKLLIAEKQNRRIAVEIKSFIGTSNAEIQNRLVIDEKHDQYLIISEGWQYNQRYHSVLTRKKLSLASTSHKYAPILVLPLPKKRPKAISWCAI